MEESRLLVLRVAEPSALQRQGETMGRGFAPMVLCLVIACARCALVPQPAAADTSAKESRQLLARWREIRELVRRKAVPASHMRQAAMVLAWGQPLEDLDHGQDAELLDLIKTELESPEFVRGELARALADFDAEGDSYADRRGCFLSAFISTVDGSGQIYSLYVPPGYDPGRSYPLEVQPACYLNYRTPEGPEQPLDRFVVGCGGRGQNGIEQLGELDALEAIRDVQSYYHIDPDRIYLTGGSIGGGGVWRLASRYPDLFAAATVDAGWTWTSTLYLENASNLPLWVYHDATDTSVPADESRTAYRTLSELASPIIYRETSGGGHSGRLKDPSWDTQGWLLRQRRDRYPERVFYTTATPARGRAYWLEILDFADPNALATVRAHVRAAGEETQLFLSLENVGVLRVELPEKLFPRDRPLSLTAGGAPARVSPPLPKQLYVQQPGDPNRAGPLLISRVDPREPKPFREYAAGGLHWMYTSGEPLLIVRGTGGDDQPLVAGIARFCELLSRRSTGWWPFPMSPFLLGRIPVKADTEVTAEDMQRCNLVLVGPASVNRVLAGITARLPAREEGGLLRVGSEQYDPRGKGYGLLYYNPEAPQRLIMVMSSAEASFYRSAQNGIADRLGDERPLGLILRQLDPPRMVRQIAWDKEWRVPEESFASPHLPEAFTGTGRAVQDLSHRAMRRATGADFVFCWRPEDDEGVGWEVSSARWSDLAVEVGQARTLFTGWASGADLLKLAHYTEVPVALDPHLDEATVGAAASYRICMDPNMAKWFVQATGHPVRGCTAVRTDLFQEIKRVFTAQDH